MKSRNIKNDAFIYLFEIEDYKHIIVQSDFKKNNNKEFIRIVKDNYKTDITLEDFYKIIDIGFIDAIMKSNK